MKPDANLDLSRYEFAEKVLREWLPRAPSKVVSDIGAGSGLMRSVVEQAGGQWQGFDLVPTSQEILSWDLDQPPPSAARPAGMVLFLDVLEHLNNPGLGLQNLAAATAPEGFLVLTTPNPLWSRSRFEALACGNPTCFKLADLTDNHHVYTPWPHIVAHQLQSVGFTVRQYVTIDGRTRWPGRPINVRYPVRWLLAAACKLVESYDPSACGMSYGLIAERNA